MVPIARQLAQKQRVVLGLCTQRVSLAGEEAEMSSAIFVALSVSDARASRPRRAQERSGPWSGFGYVYTAGLRRTRRQNRLPQFSSRYLFSDARGPGTRPIL